MPCHPVGRGGVKTLTGKERLGCVHGDDAAVEEQTATVCVLSAELHIMADHDDTHAFFSKLFQNPCKGDLEIIVHTLGRLVQQEHFGILQQHFCQSSSLLLAAGQVIGMAIQQTFQPAESHHFSDFIRNLMKFFTGEYRQQFLTDILLHQQHLRILRQSCDLLRLASEFTPVRLSHATEHIQGGTLACAVTAQDTQQLTGISFHGHTLQNIRGILLIPKPDLIQSNERFGFRQLYRPFRSLGQYIVLRPIGQLVSSVADS